MLCSRLVFRQKEVTFDEILVLYDNLLYLQLISDRNIQFREKFANSLEELTKILKKKTLNPRNFERQCKRISIEIKQNLDNFLIPQRNLKKTELHLRDSYKIFPTKMPGIERRKVKPKIFIGVGYRDKGALRDKAKDGSPSWQEVAMSLKIIEDKD
jgi:hypothetical protein